MELLQILIRSLSETDYSYSLEVEDDDPCLLVSSNVVAENYLISLPVRRDQFNSVVGQNSYNAFCEVSSQEDIIAFLDTLGYTYKPKKKLGRKAKKGAKRKSIREDGKPGRPTNEEVAKHRVRELRRRAYAQSKGVKDD